ncbi:hypothetical protein CYCD_06860 [Tenuifilaceae bacterium CYCD]|nr:hypothetical protein CYCD_06860 [Tenuifilaceae bacterium CYCD]
MKATVNFIVIILLTVGTRAFAQDNYIVTRISGKVTNYKTGTQLKAGDVLQPSDRVTFDAFDSYVISISENMGRFMIKMHEPPSPDALQQLTATVKDIAIPTKRRSLMAERYKPDETQISDLRSYFGSDKFSVIGNKVSIPVNATTYPIDENKFIVFYYRVNNNPVSKKIGYEQNALMVEKDKLLATNAGDITSNEIPSVSVYLYEKNTRSSEEITKFDLLFVDQEALTNEFYTILPILRRQNMGKEDIKKYLIEYYFDFYGATDSKTIKQFVDQLVDNAKI